MVGLSNQGGGLLADEELLGDATEGMSRDNIDKDDKNDDETVREMSPAHALHYGNKAGVNGVGGVGGVGGSNETDGDDSGVPDGIDQCHYRQPETSVTPRHLRSLLAETGPEPSRYAQALVELALRGVDGNPGGQDNIALVVTRA